MTIFYQAILIQLYILYVNNIHITYKVIHNFGIKNIQEIYLYKINTFFINKIYIIIIYLDVCTK